MAYSMSTKYKISSVAVELTLSWSFRVSMSERMSSTMLQSFRTKIITKQDLIAKKHHRNQYTNFILWAKIWSMIVFCTCAGKYKSLKSHLVSTLTSYRPKLFPYCFFFIYILRLFQQKKIFEFYCYKLLGIKHILHLWFITETRITGLQMKSIVFSNWWKYVVKPTGSKCFFWLELTK